MSLKALSPEEALLSGWGHRRARTAIQERSFLLSCIPADSDTGKQMGTAAFVCAALYSQSLDVGCGGLVSDSTKHRK